MSNHVQYFSDIIANE
jgi:hypothetical protein